MLLLWLLWLMDELLQLREVYALLFRDQGAICGGWRIMRVEAGHVIMCGPSASWETIKND